jgi:hypothetical protein
MSSCDVLALWCSGWLESVTWSRSSGGYSRIDRYR